MTARARRIGLIVAALAVVAAGALAFALTRPHPSENVAPTSAAPDVGVTAARFGTFTETVQLPGRAGPPAGSSAKLAFAQPGVIQSIDVQVGQTVARGQTLAELDRASLAAAVRNAQADVQAVAPAAQSNGADVRGALAQAAIKVDADRRALEREQQLFAAGVAAAKDVDAARTQLASDDADRQAQEAKLRAGRAGVQASSAQAQARLQAAQIAYDNGVLSAPADGVVFAVLKHPGEAVDTTIPVIELGPAAGHSVTLNAPAETAARIARGDPATLRLASGAQSSGIVTAVVPAVDPSTQSATVVVSGVPDGAVAGSAVTATIVTGRLRGVLVPSSAIVQDPQTGNTVVFVHAAHAKADDAAFAMRRVTVRASDGRTALIGSGLRAGESIAAQGGYMLLAPSGG